jgi:hypothetical protein
LVDTNDNKGELTRSAGPARAAILLAWLLVGALLYGCAGTGGTQSEQPQASDGGQAGKETAKLGTPALGREDAPVVLTEYSDYQ